MPVLIGFYLGKTAHWLRLGVGSGSEIWFGTNVWAMLVPEPHCAMHCFHGFRCCGAFSTNILGYKYQLYVETYRGVDTAQQNSALNATPTRAENPEGVYPIGSFQRQKHVENQVF